MAKARTVEETALETVTTEELEIAPSKSAAIAEAEIKSAIIVALKFPRDEDRAFENLMKSCQRTSFANDASYSFPRGGNKISGASVHLAREAARVWGNIRHGFSVIADDEEERTIEAVAWDLQTNTKITAEDTFQKLIYRKAGGWIKPDERDLRELTNRRAAILKRNCIFELMPKDLIEDALSLCEVTLKAEAKKDPEGFRKRLIVLFSGLKITTKMLADKLGHKVGESSPDELLELQEIYNSIKDGNSTWAEYVNGKEVVDEETGEISMSDLKAGKEEKVVGKEAAEAAMEKVDKKTEKEKKEKAKNKERKEKPKDKGGENQGTAIGKGYIDDEQIAKLITASTEIGFGSSRLQSMIEAEGIEQLEEIPADKFDAWIKRLEALRP